MKTHPSSLRSSIVNAAALVAAVWLLPASGAAQARDLALRGLGSGLCLVARAGWGERPVVQVPCQNYSDQDWVLEYLGQFGAHFEGQARIRNRDRDLCLIVRGSGESRAVVGSCGWWADQLWWLYRDPNTGYYQLRNSNTPDHAPMCLAVRNTYAETQTVQVRCDRRSARQLWLWEGWF